MLRSFSLFFLVALFLCYEMALQVSPGVITKQLMQSLDVNVFGLGITSGSYFLTYTLMQIPAGMLFDKYPPRKMILWPLLICILGATLFSFANSMITAICARVLMGAGSAFAFIGVLTVGGHIFSGKYYALMAGCTQMLAAIGALSGAALIVPVINSLGWRETFWLLNVLGLFLLLLIYLYLKIAVKSQSVYWQTIFIQFKQVIQLKQNWVVAAYACLLWMPMAVVASLFGVPFVEQYFSIAHDTAANVVSMMWIGIAIGSPLLGFIADKSEQLIKVLFFSALLGVIAFGVIMLSPIQSTVLLAVLFFIAGIGCSGQSLSFSQVNKNNTAYNKSTAIGFNNMAVVISGFIFQPLVGFIVKVMAEQTQSAYWYGMGLVLIAYLTSALIALIFIKD